MQSCGVADGAAPERRALLTSRMQSHLLLDAQPSTPAEVAGQLLAVQAQDFLAGRYALAQRAGDSVERQEIDRGFVEQQLVRTWTMRGTLHICRAQDARWLLDLSRPRIMRKLAPRRRELSLDATILTRAHAVVADYLQEVNRASRAELLEVLETNGIRTEGQRGYHLLLMLALQGLIVLGPVPPDATLNAQQFVLLDQWVVHHESPAQPMNELLRRYLIGHGPATLADAAWYTGQTLTTLRTAATALAEQLIDAGQDEQGRTRWVVRSSRAHKSLDAQTLPELPRRLLGPFDEYYLSYADRELTADAPQRAQIGPGANGLVKASWMVAGRIQGPWNTEAAPTDRLGMALHRRYLNFRG